MILQEEGKTPILIVEDEEDIRVSFSKLIAERELTPLSYFP
jgi:hypothetical protein